MNRDDLSPDPVPVSCELLQEDLVLYAEGELLLPAAIEAVRSHLDGCEDCRERLAEHDRLTAAILVDGMTRPASRSRVDRIMAPILALPPRFSSAFIESSLEERARPPRSRPPRKWPPRRWTPWMVGLAAAALLAISLILSSAPGRLGRPGMDLAGAAGDGQAIAAQIVSARRAEPPAAPDWRWIARAAPAAACRAPTAPLLVLHGYRRAPEVVELQAIVPEWIVEASASPRSALEDRFFLVPEGAEETLEGAVEIDPVRWSAASGAELPGWLRDASPSRPCRVYVIHGISSLGQQGLPSGSLSSGMPGSGLPPGVTNPWKQYSGWRQ